MCEPHDTYVLLRTFFSQVNNKHYPKTIDKKIFSADAVPLKWLPYFVDGFWIMLKIDFLQRKCHFSGGGEETWQTKTFYQPFVGFYAAFPVAPARGPQLAQQC